MQIGKHTIPGMQGVANCPGFPDFNQEAQEVQAAVEAAECWENV